MKCFLPAAAGRGRRRSAATPNSEPVLSTPQAGTLTLKTDAVTLDHVGAYRITSDHYRAVVYANLFDETESDIGREEPAGELSVAVETARSTPQKVQRDVPVEFGHSLYWLAALILIGEWLYALQRPSLERLS